MKKNKIVTLLLILSFMVVSVSAKELNDKINDKISEANDKINDKLTEANELLTDRIGDMKDKTDEDISPFKDGSILVTEDYKKGIGKVVFTHFKDNTNSKTSDARLQNSLNTYNTACSVKLGAQWYKQDLPMKYVINPTNSEYIPVDSVKSAISASSKTWDDKTRTSLFMYTTIDSSAPYGYDGKNAISFGQNPSNNVIAQTTIWYIPQFKRIVEADLQFNTYWKWGTNGASNLMDLQNIATHELGHTIGAGDVYSSSCNKVTMYGYGSAGETQKRTLESPDVYILRLLYGY